MKATWSLALLLAVAASPDAVAQGARARTIQAEVVQQTSGSPCVVRHRVVVGGDRLFWTVLSARCGSGQGIPFRRDQGEVFPIARTQQFAYTCTMGTDGVQRCTNGDMRRLPRYHCRITSQVSGTRSASASPDRVALTLVMRTNARSDCPSGTSTVVDTVTNEIAIAISGRSCEFELQTTSSDRTDRTIRQNSCRVS